MANRVGIYTGWERKGFYYGAQATYGGNDPGATIKVLENTGNYPPKYAGKDIGSRPTARGLSYPVIEDTHLGRGGVKGYSVEHDLTQTIWRDMAILLWQLNITNSAPKYQMSPHTSGAEAAKWASLYQYATISTDTGAFSGYQIETAVPTQLTLTVPQSDPDSEGSICTLGVDWIGRSCEAKTTFDAPVPVDDPAAKILGHEVQFGWAGVDFNVLESTVVLTNGAFLSAESSSDDLAPRIFLGMCGWSGTVKVFVEDINGSNTISKRMMTSYTSKAAVDATWTLSASNVISLPIMISDVPQMEDIEGGKAISFSFMSGAIATGASTITLEGIINAGTGTGIANSQWPTA